MIKRLLMKPVLFLPAWFFKAKFLGRKNPLQSVVFISDKCNLTCKHCSVYARKEPNIKTYEQVRDDLQYCYDKGSRFVDFEGGEPTLWRDGDYDLNSLLDLAKEIGFFSTTVTTNAFRPFPGLRADSIWVSLDGLGKFHDSIRGNGVFERLVKNIEESGHPNLSVNMVVSAKTYKSLDETIEFAKNNPHIKSISINIYTPFGGVEGDELYLDRGIRNQVIDKVIEYKRRGYPIMNSISGLKLMKHNKFRRSCWVTNFVMADGTRLDECNGAYIDGVCDECGLCMAGEMSSVLSLKPDTILAGLNLRV
jgi:MoaA/NifB/PqqE/SkfB family radical SAM enzyme